MSFDPAMIRTTAQLRALSHPLRMAIIEALTLDGPLTATELADRLDETPANCSWHLRKLAEHRFVEETGDGAGRRRPWRMTRIGFSWRDADAEKGPGYEAAAMALQRAMIQRHVDGYLARAAGPSWAGCGATDMVAYLTEEETLALNAELQSVVLRYYDRLADPASRPAAARAVHILALTSVDPGDPAAAAVPEPLAGDGR